MFIRIHGSKATVRQRTATLPPSRQSTKGQIWNPETLTNVMIEQVSCPHCGSAFTPKRTNMKYCSRRCKNNRWQNEDRQKQRANLAIAGKSSKNRINYELFESTIELTLLFHRTHPRERLGYIKDLVDDARNGNAKLRQILSNKQLQYPEAASLKRMMRKNNLDLTVCRRADAYCRHFWDAPVRDVVYNKVAEPATGEVI
ncbi:MAG: hypothetical protein R3D80_05585 [Paracoccaceae bacterium]